MLRKIFSLVFFIPFFSPAFCFQLRDNLEISSELETSAGVYYTKPEEQIVVDFPLYFQAGLFYETEQIEGALSISFPQELDIGETYLKGGSEYSYLKIGYFLEEWGKGYSVK